MKATEKDTKGKKGNEAIDMAFGEKDLNSDEDVEGASDEGRGSGL